MFKSDSVRELVKIKRGPGPSYYKNANGNDKKQIFNFNPKKIW